MEKLKNLVELANESKKYFHRSVTVNPDTILAIAEAFSALEQRIEAAEAEVKHQLNVNALVCSDHQKNVAERKALRAKLAELEKQEPAEYQYYYHNHGTGAGQWLPVHCKQAFEKMKAKHAGDNDFSFRELFTRPAPAVSLAELVPNPSDNKYWWNEGHGTRFKVQTYHDDVLAILRNIEEAK